jgi:2-hydroxychromene-2-carboxylate isomerase
MTEQSDQIVDAFIDLRSPYSYLVLKPARSLAERSGIKFEWWPYITDFRSAYGGEVEQRSTRDIAKLKYLYMDCRRLARRQGLVIRATTKLWDVELASQALLFAKARDRLWEFCDPLLTAFWRREFDLESPSQLETTIAGAGLAVGDWHEYLQVRAQRDFAAALAQAEQLGVFGAPTFVYRGKLFWGGDRLDLLAESLGEPSSRP